jgi:hypothetical protein
MLLYAGDSEREKDVLRAFTRFVFPMGARPRSNLGSAARSRGSTGALDCAKFCTVNRHNREIARLPIASSVKQHIHNQTHCGVGYCTSEEDLVYSQPY